MKPIIRTVVAWHRQQPRAAKRRHCRRPGAPTTLQPGYTIVRFRSCLAHPLRYWSRHQLDFGNGANRHAVRPADFLCYLSPYFFGAMRAASHFRLSTRSLERATNSASIRTAPVRDPSRHRRCYRLKSRDFFRQERCPRIHRALVLLLKLSIAR
jgi:hypothetical protein